MKSVQSKPQLDARFKGSQGAPCVSELSLLQRESLPRVGLWTVDSQEAQGDRLPQLKPMVFSLLDQTPVLTKYPTNRMEPEAQRFQDGGRTSTDSEALELSRFDSEVKRKGVIPAPSALTGESTKLMLCQPTPSPGRTHVRGTRSSLGQRSGAVGR